MGESRRRLRRLPTSGRRRSKKVRFETNGVYSSILLVAYRNDFCDISSNDERMGFRPVLSILSTIYRHIPIVHCILRMLFSFKQIRSLGAWSCMLYVCQFDPKRFKVYHQASINFFIVT